MFNWIYPTKSETLSPKKLIEIKNNELILDTFDIPADNEITVYSIVGTARTGKSTLLNCIGSYFLKKNVKIFNIDDSDEHCTIGIDMYYFEKEKIVLLDCQGLKLDDSSNDPKLLLIIYLISDCIIYNQRSILNNDIFETLQPLATFLNYIENINYKPKLIFRILDSELKYEPKKLLEKTMSNKKDQYQNTREAMLSLFSSIDLCVTNSLDRNEKKLLQQHKFYDFMMNEENNFMNSIESILTHKNEQRKFTQWYTLITKFIASINSNKKIDFNKLDIYWKCIENEILTFKLMIDSDNYKNFSCGILNAEYEQIVVPKIEYKDNILNMFHSKFNMTSKKIYDQYYNEIKQQLENPITTVTQSIVERTHSQIKNSMSTYFKDTKHFTFASRTKIITIKEYRETHDTINKNISNFISTIKKYYSPVVNEYIALFENYSEKINTAFEDLVKIQNLNFQNVVNFFSEAKNEYPSVCKILLQTDFNKIFSKYNIQEENYYSFIQIVKNQIVANLLNPTIFDTKLSNGKRCRDIFNGLDTIMLLLKKSTCPINSEIFSLVLGYLTANDFFKYEKMCLDIENFNIDLDTRPYSNFDFTKYFPKEKITAHVRNEYNMFREMVFQDVHIDKIIQTKILQNNLYRVRTSYMLDNKMHEKFFSKICSHLNLEIKAGGIEKKRLHRKLCLEEFKKYLIKKIINARGKFAYITITCNKKLIVENLLISEPKITKLYKDFLFERLLLNNCIDGIQIE
jgi:hypothetical protein